ncbi:hypothetical protein Sjap_013230 [Stephania japonica]|uniref:Uncharacterized protein n=1 Tax=Stephania japonica TaxID=461633 RepID=A0AAP0IXQ5_9MAGN
MEQRDAESLMLHFQHCNCPRTYHNLILYPDQVDIAGKGLVDYFLTPIINNMDTKYQQALQIFALYTARVSRYPKGYNEIRETVHIEPKRERIEIRICGECRLERTMRRHAKYTRQNCDVVTFREIRETVHIEPKRKRIEIRICGECR